jgi:hypothetical protein
MFHLLDVGRRMKIIGIEELVLQLLGQTGSDGGFARAGYTHENNRDWLIHNRKSFVRSQPSSKFTVQLPGCGSRCSTGPDKSRQTLSAWQGGISSCKKCKITTNLVGLTTSVVRP